MPGDVTNTGEETSLRLLFDEDRQPRLRLFKNDFTPSEGAVLADFQQADFAGYNEISLDRTVGPNADGEGRLRYAFPASTFTRTTAGDPQTAYGWYVVIKNADGTPGVFAADRFSAPRVVQAAGDKVVFDLNVYAVSVPE